MTRTRRNTVTFHHPFRLKAVGRDLPAGVYEIVNDEELVDGLSFPVYRRVASWIMAPTANGSSATEMLSVEPPDIAAAQARDQARVAADANAPKPDASGRTSSRG